MDLSSIGSNTNASGSRRNSRQERHSSVFSSSYDTHETSHQHHDISERINEYESRSFNRHGTIRARATTPSIASTAAAAAAAPMEASLCVMSVVLEGSDIAFCCYNQKNNDITIENCSATGYETEALVERFLHVTRPNLVLVG
jgi:hypothetical protein